MNILGLGTDIVEISRIAEMLEKHGDHFLSRTFSQGENEYCASKKHSAQHYAGRWAAKEAVVKSFGTGFVRGIYWTEIEVINEVTGRPSILLSGETAEYASQIGITTLHLSISHGKEYAVATVIACGE